MSSATHTKTRLHRIAVAISEAHQKTRPPLVAHCWPSQRPPAQSYTMRSTHPASTMCSWNACKLQRSLTTPGPHHQQLQCEFTRLQVDASAHCTAAVPCVSARCSAQLDAAVVESAGTGCVHASVSRVGDTPEATPDAALFFPPRSQGLTFKQSCNFLARLCLAEYQKLYQVEASQPTRVTGRVYSDNRNAHIKLK